LTHTDVDNSGKSYYGETNLYLISLDGSFDGMVDLGESRAVSAVDYLADDPLRQGRTDLRLLLEPDVSRVCGVLWL